MRRSVRPGQMHGLTEQGGLHDSVPVKSMMSKYDLTFLTFSFVQSKTLPLRNYSIRTGIGRIVIAGLQNPDCIPFWWIAPGFEIHSKKQDLIADWIASYFQFLQSNPDCNPFLGQLVMSDIFPILIGLE